MTSHCTLQIHHQGRWHDAATVALWGDADQGWRCKTYAGYEADWSVDHFGQQDAHALSCRWPVGLEAMDLPHWPVFLIDMLPQGFGRAEFAELARVAGVSQKTLLDIEQGRSPGTVQTLNRILGVVGLKLGVVRAR
eukprot:gene6715-6566_t